MVGAGPGGLGAAVLLAASGIDVTVFEAQPVIGGRTARLTLEAPAHGAFHFDRGPTFFLMPFVLDEIFSAAGERLSSMVDLIRLDPMYRLMLGREGGRDADILDCTQDVDQMVRRLAKFSPHDAAAFPRFLRENRVKLDRFTPVLRRGFRSALDLTDPVMLKALPHLAPTKSVHSYLAGFFDDPRVRLAMSFQTKYLGMSPFKCPSLFSILPFIEYEYGVWHVRGGLNRLMDALAKVLLERSGRIRTGAPVRGVEFEGRKAVGVRLDEGVQRFDHVLINADAPWAIKNLIPKSLRHGLGARLRGAWSDGAIDAMDYSCSTYMLYLGLREPVDLPHHTIYISSDYERNIRDISEGGCLSPDPSLYVCNPSAIDPTMAPRGCAALYVLVPTPNLRGSIDWARDAAGLRERALNRVSAMIGKAVGPLVVCEEAYSPLDWQGMNIAVGATFNLAHGLMQMLHRRPQHELAGVENVWLAGGGTHPGSGLPVIFLSSQIAAQALCKRLGVAYAGAAPPVPRVDHESSARSCSTGSTTGRPLNIETAGSTTTLSR